MKAVAFIFLASFLVILSMLVEIGICDQTYSWTVQRKTWFPDGVEAKVIAINDQFPGPTIRATVGEKLVISVTNGLKEGLAIHWHGIRQFGTPWADGTANITQCPTPPGKTFIYKFTVDKAGTYFYHGHSDMLRVDGLSGLIIVQDVDKGKVGDLAYDGELELLLNDWWHKNSTQQEAELSTKPMIWVGEPQSLLINGRGQYICSMAAGVSISSTSPCSFNGSEEYAPDILRVSSSKTYRVRLVSATSLASLNFAIENHTLQVVEADGNLVQPFSVDNIFIYPGQSFSVLINATQDPTKRYWLSIGVVARKPNTTQGLTVLSYDTDEAARLPMTKPPVVPTWDDTNLSKAFARRILGTRAPPKKQDVRIYLLNTQNFIHGFTKWALNNVSLVLPATAYLGAIRYKLKGAFDQKSPPTNFSGDYDVMSPATNQNAITGDGIYRLELNEVVDVILQNANAVSVNKSETHPWHLHGHDFWVMGYGEGRFTDGDEATFNYANPALRNTEVVFPYGWTALRFVADNPGVWAFHCHIEAHMHMGMGVVFAEGTEKLGDVPTEGLQCGLVTNT